MKEEKARSFHKLWRIGLFVLIVGGAVMYVMGHWRDYAFSVFRPYEAASGEQDFFIELRLDREKHQKDQMDHLKGIIDDKEASKEVRDTARLQYMQVLDHMSKESKIEDILSAKGLESVAVLSQDTCTVIVRKATLDQKDVAQVGDVVKRVTGIRPENVSIIPTDR